MAYDPSRASPTVKEPKAQSGITLDALLDEFEVSDPAVRDRVLRLAGVESSGSLNATGPRVNGGMHNATRARGALQIMPATAKAYPQYDLNDPADASRAGLHYFLDNLNQFGGDLDAATIAHHAGPGTAKKWLREGRAGTVDRATGLSTDDYLLKVTGGKRAKPAEKWWESDPVAPAEAAGNWWESDPVEPAEEPGLIERGLSAIGGLRKSLQQQTTDYEAQQPQQQSLQSSPPQSRATPPNPLDAGSLSGLAAGMGPVNMRTALTQQQGANPMLVSDEELLSNPGAPKALKAEENRREMDAYKGAYLAGYERDAKNLRLEGDDARQFAQQKYDEDFAKGAPTTVRPEASWKDAFNIGATQAGRGMARGFYATLESVGDMVGSAELSQYAGEDRIKQEEAIASSLRTALGKVPEKGFKSIVGDAIPTIISQGAPIAAAALATVATRNPEVGKAIISAGVLAPMGVQSYGNAYADGKQKGLALEDRVTYGVGTALAEVLPERISLGYIMDLLTKPLKAGGKKAAEQSVAKELAKRYFQMQGSELATEEITTVSQFLLDRYYTNPDLTLKDLQEQMIRTALVTPIATTALGAAGAAGTLAGSAINASQSDLASGLQTDQRITDAIARQSLDPSNAQMREVAPLDRVQPPQGFDYRQETANVAPPLDAASYQGQGANQEGGAGLASDGRVGNGGTGDATGAAARSGEPGVSVGEAERQQVAGVVEQKIAEKEAEAIASGDPIEVLVTRAEGAAMRRAVTPQPANGIDIDQDALLADVEAMFTEGGNLMVQGDNAREAVKRIDPKALASALPRGDGALLVPKRFAGPVMDALQGAKQRVSVAFGGDGMMQAPDVAQFRATVPTQEEVQDVPKAEQVDGKAQEAGGQEGEASKQRFVGLAAYNITNADPLKAGDSALSRDDALFELDVLQDRADRGRLTPDAFAQSGIAQRLDTAQMMTINGSIRAGDFSFIGALKSRIEQAQQPTQATAAQEGEATGEGAEIGAVAEQPTQAPTAPEQSSPASAQAKAADKPKRQPPARKPDPVTVERAQRNAEDLRAMAQDAGWAEEGGKLIRDAEDNVSRTKWIPRAEWFMAGMEARPDVLAQHIEAAARGEWIPAKSARTIEGMVEWLDAQRGQATLGEDASMYDFEASFGDVLDVPDAREVAEFFDDAFGGFAEQSEADAMRALGFTEEEIANAVGQTQAGAGSAETADARGTAEAGERAGEAGAAQTQAGAEGQQEGLTLDAYTPADIAQREAEQQDRAEADAKAERDAAARQRQAEERAEVRRRSEAAADTFELGMDPMENLTGQSGLFGQTDSAPQPARTAASAASANTIFTEDAAEKARALLRRKLGQLNSGVDPEMLQAGITLAGYHIEKGARSFAAYARAMLGDLGESVRPYLKSWYVAIAFDPRARGFEGMDNIAAVQAADENADFTGMAQKEQGNGTDERGDSGVEPDRRDAEAQDGVGEEGIRAEPGRDAAGRGQGVQGTRADSGARRSGELSGREAAPARERGDLTVYTGATDVPGSATRSDLDRRSADPGLDGAPVEPDAAKAVEAAARGGSRLAATKAAQAEADATPHGNSLEGIRAALPALLPGQQEDVFKAEQRFAKPDGYGMLFTNGTGTGKTFTGLGIVKRFALAGKTNALIVAPNDKIIEDWQKSGRVLGLDIGRLQDTNDAGAGIVITTYANFGDNAALASREWDLVVSDESHYLMQDKDGTPTSYLRSLRAITLHPDGVYRRHEMLNGDELAERNRLAADAKMLRTSDDERQWAQAEEVQDKADALSRKLEEKFRALEADVKARQGAARPRAAFLSATPFAYEKTIDWANGYLFDYNEGQPSEAGSFRGYNDGGNRERFFMQHLGYRMRYNKLTQPDAKVDSGLMQRQFNGWLKKKGSLSGRMLDVPFDYDRRFILVDSAIGTRIDAALTWLREEGGRIAEAGGDRRGVDALKFAIDEKFDYLSRRYLLEAIKAAEVIPHVREHLALGRKVVVFHDYKKGGGFNPFVQRRLNEGGDDADAAAARKAYNAALDAFNQQFADLIGSDIAKMPNPIEAFQRAFPDVLLFNGNVPKQQRRASVAKFQDDASGPQVILVQSAAGKEGISLHDTTGKYQRVLFNLGQPTQPTTAIQQEGRIYRTGQQSDAIIRYLNTGTNWEKWAFASTIAQRASAAENLGAGEQARALKDAFIQGFEESDAYRAGMEGEGKGGKERDRLANEAISEYDRAKAYYFGQQKKTTKTKAQEGADYFATPEPVGLKMVEWADIRPGERVLEPSAGHGAIARWMPENAERTAIEPSSTLLPRLAMVFDGKIQDTTFEALNVVNKFDAIVMNPPFGSGGKTAIEHVAKAATHLRDKGRIVALIPAGPAADKRFDKWFYETEDRPVKPIVQHDFGTGPIAIYRGDTVRSRAAWAPEAVVMRKSETGGLWVKVAGTPGETQITLQSLTGHTNTGPRTETVRPAEGLHLIADIKMPGATFERAGTRVATRIVVIEKQSDPAVAQNLAERQRDYTGVEDIGELFDRLEDLMLPKRTGVVEADAAPADRAEQASDRPKPKAANPDAVGTVERQGLPIVEHTTAKGKVIRGVIRTDLSKEQAQKIDPYTWKKGGGFFIREQYLKPEGGAPAMSRTSGQEAAPAMTRSALVQSISSRFPSLTRAVESALRRGDEGKPGGVVVVERAEDLARMFAEKTGRSIDDAVQSLGSTDGRDANGLFDSRSGLTFLVAPNLTERTAPAVLLHEATHGKQRAEIDRKAMDLIETRQARSKPLRDFLFRVEQRMDAAGESGNVTEAAAYIVEEAVVAGRQAGFSAVDGKLMNWIDLKFGRRVSDIVRDFVAMIRAWAMRAGVDLSPTVDDLVAIAKLNVRDMARGDVTGGEGAKESRASQTEAFKRLADLLGGASAARDMLSSGSQSIVDGLKRDAEMISNLLESQSIGSELNSLGDVPLSVVPHVLNVTDDEKVLRAIVRSIPVDVMDFFARKKLSPKKVLSNKAMLEEVLSVDSKTSVPLGVNKSIARSLVGSVARAAAEISGLAGGPLKFNTASFTGANNTIFGAQDNLINEGLGDAKDITKTENFLNWFGDSKAVDESGRPLAVYHGTDADITEFKVSERGTYGGGIYLTPDTKGASDYAIYRGSKSPTVYPLYVSIKNPATGAEAARVASWKGEENARSELIARGYDGVIDMRSGEIVAFYPEQVKSAAGNNGNFDPTDRRINFSRTGQATMSAPATAAQPAQAAPRAAQAQATPPDETRFQAFQRKAQDKLNRFTVIKEWLAAQGVTLSEQADVYKAEERMHSRFANKADDFREKTVKPLVEKIQRAGYSMDDVAQYLHAQHAEERNIQIASINKQMPDGGSGMKTADANAILAAAPAELKRLANEFRAITERTKQILLDSGIISQDMADAWEATYQHYVPLKGGPEQGGKGAGKGLKANYKGRRALGHTMREEGEWIVENILADHERAIMLAEKNRIGQSLLKMAIEVGRNDLLTVGKPEKRGVLKNNTAYEVLFKGKVIGAFQSLEAARTFRATAPAAMKSASPSEFGIRKVSDPTVAYMASPMLAENEVNVYVRGQAIRVQINDELLARAYGNMGVEALGAILRVGATINGYFSKIYTGYNPEFILTNIVRDFTTGVANVTGEEGAMMALRAAKDYPASFADLFRYATTGNASQWIRMYREDGGNTGAAYLSDLERLGDEISTEYAAYKGVLANLKAGDVKSAARAAGRKAFDKTLVWVERINQAGENAMRLSIYKAMIESGKSRAEAASLAKNATVNFNRNGEVGRQMNALWLFYNAGVQGTAAIAHANLKGRHKWQARAVSAGILGLGYTMAVALGAGDDEDDYDKLSDYTKARNVVIKTGDGWLKIPVPYGYGFFWNMGRAIADAERKGEWGKAPWHVASSFIEEFTPFGAAFAGDDLTLEQVTLGALPTLAQIPASVGMNRTTMGGPMYPESAFDKYQPDNEKMWRATKGTIPDMIAQALDQGGIEVSPETIKYLTRTFTGGAGQFVTSIGDAAWLTANGASLEVKEQPFVRKFYTETDVREARSAYYAAVAEAEKAVREGKSILKMGDHAAYGAYRVENQEFYALDRMAKARAAAIKARRNYADAIRADKTLGVKEKRDRLKAAEVQEQVIYDRYLEVFKSRTRQ